MARATASSEATDGWHEARLIPTVGIRGQEEQEKRATSCLLAVMRAVPDFGHALIGELGAPKGRLSTYAEIQLKGSDGKVHIPDGAIVAERGSKRWTCLVEVKTSNAPLRGEQVTRYVDLARDNKFDAVLTISNEITASPTESPVVVNKQKLKAVRLYHLSWWRVLTEAIVQHRFRGITDPDQAWILGELIAYLDNEKSGASGFQDMGENWVRVRNAAAEGTLRANDAEARDVAQRWEQFVDYLCLGLGQDLGRDVRAVRPRKQTTQDRVDAARKQLAEVGTLSASIKVPDAAGPLTVEADLRTKRVTTSVAVDASGDGRPQTRIKWLTRQLKQAPDGLVVEVSFANTKETSACTLSDVRDDPTPLLSATDPKRQPRGFRIALSRPMGTKRGKGEKSFVRETRQQAVDFYREIVQDIKPWQPSAPKMPEPTAEVQEEATPTPPPFGIAPEREPGAAVDPGRSVG